MMKSVVLIFIMLSVVILHVILPRVVILNAIIIMLCVVMLNGIKSLFILKVKRNFQVNITFN